MPNSAQPPSASDVRYRSVIEAMPELLCEVDEAGVVLFCNRSEDDERGAAAVGACIFDTLDSLGRPAQPRSGPRLGALVRPVFARVVRTRKAEETELSFGAAEERTWRRLAFLPLPDDERIIVLHRDITARKQAEGLRHRFVERVITAQEEERRRVAQELHDALGQILTGVALRLKALEDRADSDAMAEDLAGVRSLTEQAIDEVAHIARQLRPPALDQRGLPAALRACVRDVRRSSDIDVTVEFEGVEEDVRYSAVVETALYRIAQEALANILKHSHAQRAEIVLHAGGDELRMTVTDDGRGVSAVDPGGAGERVAKAEAYGLTGIQERAALLGGRVRVESAPGHGLTLEVRVPI